MLQVDISASKRDSFGKCAMRRLRGSGNTPAVLYGNDKDVMALQLETTPFLKSLFQISRKNAIVNLSINGEDSRHVMMREIQTDPVTDSLIHADFFEINLQTPRAFTVPIEFVGTAKGTDLGGILVIHNTNIRIEGLPLEVPDNISVDISDLAIGDSIAYSALGLPDTVKMVSDASALCVEVVAAVAADESATDE
ncbi:MAG TPA: 50S ribosomal protein L25 [Desulfocapsa sulfexigens]|nr:50S ribosomal protein L25 [Desulfocapsa sulfexigens]